MKKKGGPNLGPPFFILTKRLVLVLGVRGFIKRGSKTIIH